MSLSWAHPTALLLLLTVPLYLLLARGRSRSLPFPRAAALGQGERLASILSAVPPALRAIVLLLLALAIAGPLTAGAAIEERREGVPMVLALDVSSSMLAQDFAPQDRLAVAKATIARFVEGREADPIGLVAFAGEALTLVPVTTHRPVLLSALESLRVGMVEDGTAIGDGLAATLNRLRHYEPGTGVVILLSDGENNRGDVDPLAAAEAAATLGVRVFTIAVGSDGVAAVPVGSAPEGFRYAELPVGVDEAALRSIAERTGGEYFRATDPAALVRIYDEIDQRIPAVLEVTRYTPSRDWSPLLVLLAAVSLFAEWAIRGSRWGVIP